MGAATVGVPRAVWTLAGATGLLAAVVGMVMLTVFAPAQSVGGRVTTTSLIVSGPGVASLSGGDVTVSAAGPGAVFVGVARREDVEAWLGDAPVTRVDGVVAADDLARSDVAGTGEVPDPAGSDIWLDSAAASGTAELVVPRPAAQWAVVVSGAEEATISWQRPARHPGGWPLLIGGLGVAVFAGRGLARSNARRRAARRRARRPAVHRELVGGGR